MKVQIDCLENLNHVLRARDKPPDAHDKHTLTEFSVKANRKLRKRPDIHEEEAKDLQMHVHVCYFKVETAHAGVIVYQLHPVIRFSNFPLVDHPPAHINSARGLNVPTQI